MRATFSAIKPGFAQFPASGLSLYPPGLVSALLFNEGAGVGNVAGDFVTWDSLNQVALTAKAANFATGWISGRGGPALNFNATGQLDGPSRKLDPLTWTAWIKPTALSCTICGKNDGNSVNAGWQFNCLVTPGVGITIEYNSTNLQAQTTNVPSDWVGQWHHVVFVWDGTATAANVKCYIDGVPRVLTTTTNGVGTHGSDSGNTLKVGYDVGSGGGFFSANFGGAIESILLFNAQLQASDIVGLFQASYRWFNLARISAGLGTGLSLTVGDDLNAAPWKDSLSYLGGDPNFHTEFGDNLDSPWSDSQTIVLGSSGTILTDDLNLGGGPWADSMGLTVDTPTQVFDIDDTWADSISTAVAVLLQQVFTDNLNVGPWTDAIALGFPILVSLTDTLVMLDPKLEINVGLLFGFGDILTISDTVTFLYALVAILTDSLTMSDSIAITDDKQDPFSDSMFFNDGTKLVMDCQVQVGDVI